MIFLIKYFSGNFKFNLIRIKNYLKCYYLWAYTLYHKECYFGPFVGEFGHLLSHVVPFLSYMYSKGVKVHYCGPVIHLPYFYDNHNHLIVSNYFKLRDFYSEISPECNDQIYPADIKPVIDEFVYLAKNSNLAFWDIRTRSFYFDTFCRWEYINGFIKTFKFNKINKINHFSSIVLFARKKGTYSPVRGEDWNFSELISEIKEYVHKIYVLGHPAFSHKLESEDNVEVILSSDNTIIIDKCIHADMILTQLSGTHYLGVYTDTRVLLLLKGKIDYSNIKKDRRLRRHMGEKYKLEYAFSIADVKNILTNLKQNENAKPN